MNSSRVGRGVAILAVAVLAVAVVSPAFSAAPLTKAKVKKIAKKVAKKQINTLVPGMIASQAIGEGELLRFGPVKAATGTSNAPLGTIGPLTVTGTCELVAGDVRGTIYVNTSEANSGFWSNYWGSEFDFDPSDPDGPVYWIQATGDVPGGATAFATGGNQMHFTSPSGVALEGIAFLGTNFLGSHCVFQGYVLQVGPKA